MNIQDVNELIEGFKKEDFKASEERAKVQMVTGGILSVMMLSWAVFTFAIALKTNSWWFTALSGWHLKLFFDGAGTLASGLATKRSLDRSTRRASVKGL